MSNMASELMSNKTPLFIQSGNELDGKVWVPNPACHDQQKYRFLGQLMGACIRSTESLAVVSGSHNCPAACMWSRAHPSRSPSVA